MAFSEKSLKWFTSTFKATEGLTVTCVNDFEGGPLFVNGLIRIIMTLQDDTTRKATMAHTSK